jgi:hypothetical protein
MIKTKQRKISAYFLGLRDAQAGVRYRWIRRCMLPAYHRGYTVGLTLTTTKKKPMIFKTLSDCTSTSEKLRLFVTNILFAAAITFLISFLYTIFERI